MARRLAALIVAVGVVLGAGGIAAPVAQADDLAQLCRNPAYYHQHERECGGGGPFGFPSGGGNDPGRGIGGIVGRILRGLTGGLLG